MYFKKKTEKSTEDYWDKIKKIKEKLDSTTTILLGAGAGLSTSAGLHYSGERFQRLMPDYIEKYNLTDMYSAAFYPHKTSEEFWGYFSKHIYFNRYHQEWNDTYGNLLKLVSKKDYFVLTTNADHGFVQGNFDKKRLWYMQGNYGVFQCSVPCHQETYHNEKEIHAMVEQQKNFKIPSELIPYCPKCGKEMSPNLRKDHTFVEDQGWHEGYKRYENFLSQHKEKEILFLELGVGFNTPGIIKYPFWQMTYDNKNASYICLNLNESDCPKEILGQSICLSGDIQEILHDLI